MPPKVKAPAKGQMFVYRDMLVAIDGAPETVAGRYVVPYSEVTSNAVPVGDEIPEDEWPALQPVREPLAGLIRRAVAGEAPAWLVTPS